MSEILLKNIEFPKEETLTLVITSSGEVYRIPRKYDRNDTVVVTGSKAVELPPHGRLGDLDLMKENFAESLRITRQQVELDSDSPFYGLQQRDLANAEKLVNGLIGRTPTVLEASEVEMRERMKAILTGHQPRQLANNPIPPNVAPAYMPNKDNEASYRQVKQEVNGVVSKKALLEAFDNYGCPKERNTYLFKALRKLVEDANEL